MSSFKRYQEPFLLKNLRIILGEKQRITKGHLISKALIHQEGGVCYEINPLLYYFLKENQFQPLKVQRQVKPMSLFF
ncbi:arylamine N-acetyltransferase [Halobacillus sp. Marseille-Q1614]|uniref:arylamine N-acetyltransferase n=1 Tax=Halobacillus sp. Marseille-Q1614 TaxID=2709134 RepID=UPI0020C2E6DD|nr:arylamine N-acetyltransferase [Halobacillus sp. Marseille-Q1614]